MSSTSSVPVCDGASASPRAGGTRARIYKNGGNPSLLALLDREPALVLDVGCGAGDNSRLLKSIYPRCQIHGVTHSTNEASLAKQWMADCWVFDIERPVPEALSALRFDAIIFSHVLEHLRYPAATLRSLSSLLVRGGSAIIAVPNTLSWATRWQLLRGHLEYTSEGVFDDTHLRFFTYTTADRYLLSASPGLRLVSKSVTGKVPQWWLRRYLLPQAWSARIDGLGCSLWPNLFGEQVLLKAVAEHATAVS